MEDRSVLVRITTAVIKYNDQQQLGEEKWFTLPIIVHHRRKSGQQLKQGRDLEAGADAEAWEDNCLLTCSIWLAQPTFL